MDYVLVTGACGGMGRAAVESLRESGYCVIAMDKVLPEQKEKVIPIQADITDIQSLQSAFEQICTITDSLYAIVHFAGIYILDSLVEIDEEEFKKTFDINVFGPYRINKVFLPLLKPGSRIILTTSELAPLDPLPFTGLYAITKSTLDKYAYSLRMELQLLGIRVVVLRPGAVRTGMLQVSMDGLDRFCLKTLLYACNARRFRRIVQSVEARNIEPARIARKVSTILSKKRLAYVYKINRNPLLLLLNILPGRMQTWIIKQVLK